MIDLLFISMTSGLLAGVTSCTLPTYPILLNILSRNRRHRFLSTIVFVSGLVLAYIIFYSVMALLILSLGWGFADSIDEKRRTLFLFAALLSFFFALSSLIHLNVLKRSFVLLNKIDYPGNAGTFLSGLSYGTVITPCSAPFLVTGIMPVLASKITYPQGFVLMSLFSLSIGLPLLVLGVASAYALESIRLLKKNTRTIESISSLFLVAVGLYFLRLYTEGG